MLRTAILSTFAGLLLLSCAATRPGADIDVCHLFEERRSWYKAARSSEERWGAPVPVSMAFIHQESGFRSRAKPRRTRILWLFPGPRPSSAYGYAQALESTWEDYVSQSGNRNARRDDFADAIDFIGWYNAMSSSVNRIAPDDAANLYLAYHEGNTGFARGSHREKPWLLETAARLQDNAVMFQIQYAGCVKSLERNWFFRLFS